MRIAFGDFTAKDYTVATVRVRPMGGSQSALSYLAETFARRGHDVHVFNFTTMPGDYLGVHCHAVDQMTEAFLQSLDLDVFIILNGAGNGALMRDRLGVRPRLVLWTGHPDTEAAVQPLASAAERTCYDAFAFVSEWQRSCYQRRFQIEPDKTVIHRNAMAPAFENMFPEGTDILTAKSQPPVLVYTSVPDRGLALLVELFPLIRHRVPGAMLRVFSSTTLYQISKADDESAHGAIYQRCREVEGIELIGSVPQPELAAAMKSASVWAYSSTVAETSCITAMEAMAAGCFLVTSELGGVPETTFGFANLIRHDGGLRQYALDFADAVVDFLSLPADEAESHLRQQHDFANDEHVWSHRAAQWEDWLQLS